MSRLSAFAAALALLVAPSARADLATATFEDLNVAPNSVKNNFSPAAGFTSGGFTFNNTYTGYLAAGFAVSSKIDNVAVNSPGDSADYDHQYGAYSPTGASGTGSGGSATYAVAYAYAPTDATIDLPSGFAAKSIDVANTTYLVSSLLYGDQFNSHVFAAGDNFILNILGFAGAGATGSQVGSVSFYLVGDAQGHKTFVDHFTTVDLASLVGARSLGFSIDTNIADPTFGPTLPFEFAVDNVVGIRSVPEPASFALVGLGLAALAAFRLRKRRASTTLAALMLLVLPASSQADYDPQVGLSGSLGIAKASPLFTEWASSVDSFTRGPQDITNPTGPLATYGTPGNALGAIGPKDAARVVSLGDGGQITLGFAQPIANGPGVDFAVFENGFLTGSTGSGLAFLELGFVDVSSDGVHFFRFPSVSLTQTTTQVGSFDSLDARNLHDLAGKYIGGYGTGFDLSELASVSPLLDINNVTEVRITDVVGSIDPRYGTHDSLGNLVNDPFKTSFASGGFDLNGVGVINLRSVPEPAGWMLLATGCGILGLIGRSRGVRSNKTVEREEVSR